MPIGLGAWTPGSRHLGIVHFLVTWCHGPLSNNKLCLIPMMKQNTMGWQMLLQGAARFISYFMSLVMICYILSLFSMIMLVRHTWQTIMSIIKGPNILKLIFILFETRYLLKGSEFYMCYHQDNLLIYLGTVCTDHEGSMRRLEGEGVNGSLIKILSQEPGRCPTFKTPSKNT
jgi:hypothetical protein